MLAKASVYPSFFFCNSAYFLPVSCCSVLAASFFWGSCALLVRWNPTTCLLTEHTWVPCVLNRSVFERRRMVLKKSKVGCIPWGRAMGLQGQNAGQKKSVYEVNTKYIPESRSVLPCEKPVGSKSHWHSPTIITFQVHQHQVEGSWRNG